MHRVSILKPISGVLAVAAGFGLATMSGLLITDQAEGQNSVEARLHMVEERQAIEQLLMGDYPKALDSADWKTYASFFTEDGELIQGSTVTKGPAAIEALFSRPPAATTQAAQRSPAINKHIVTNLNLHIDGDTATDTAYWQTVSTRDGVTTIAAAGHYVDVLRKVNGQWKFQHREIVNPLREAD